MNSMDSRTAKIAGMIVFICIVFILLVANAYKYIPADTEKVNTEQSEIVESVANEEDDKIDEQKDENEEKQVDESEQDKEQEIIRNKKSSVDSSNSKFDEKAGLEPLENVDEISVSNNENSYSSIIESAKQSYKDKQYQKAISEYVKASELTDNKEDKALCYEEISNIYAIAKRYGTALSYAQKAHRLAPTTSREVLLARLYYKVGDVDNATMRMNNILNRNFTAE